MKEALGPEFCRVEYRNSTPHQTNLADLVKVVDSHTWISLHRIMKEAFRILMSAFI